MEFIGEYERVDGDLYWIVRIPIRPTQRKPNMPIIGKTRDRFYLYAAKEIDSYLLKLVGARPDPNLVKQNINLRGLEE